MSTAADLDLRVWYRHSTTPHLDGNNTSSPRGGSQYPVGTITGYGVNPVDGYTETATNTYYLDAVSGNDTTGDGSTVLPYKTIAKILTVMGSGDTVILRDGNYGLFSQVNPAARTDWITFKADNGHVPVFSGLSLDNTVLTAVYLRFDGITFSATSLYGTVLDYAKYVEILNCKYNSATHKYDVDSAVNTNNSENILIYYCDMTEASRCITVSSTSNMTFSRNHGHGLSGSSGINYGGGNTNFIIEKNNVYDSNFDTWDVDPNSPYDPSDSSGHPHSSAVAIRSNDLWLRGNVFHDIGSSSGIYFYMPDVAGGEEIYSNIIIENNLAYDIQSPYVLFLNNIGTNIVIKNNTLVGHLRDDTTNATYKLRQAMVTPTLATGHDGSGLSIYNNIFVGVLTLPSPAVTANNIIWSYALSGTTTFLSTPPDANSVILTYQSGNYPIEYWTGNFFLGISVESDFSELHGLTYDFNLHADSEAVNLGDTVTQSGLSLGQIDALGFIQDDGVTRGVSNHCAGAYEI